MIIEGRTFTPAPEGVHDAVCVDVVDLGNVETQWGIKPKIRLVFELGAVMADGRRFVQGRRYTASLDSRSMLHKHLRGWRGKPFTPDELRAFDMDVLLGKPCQIVIGLGDNEKGEQFSVIEAILRARPEKSLQPSGDYIRMIDRVQTQSGDDHQDDGWPTQAVPPRPITKTQEMSAVLSGRTQPKDLIESDPADNIPF